MLTTNYASSHGSVWGSGSRRTGNFEFNLSATRDEVDMTVDGEKDGVEFMTSRRGTRSADKSTTSFSVIDSRQALLGAYPAKAVYHCQIDTVLLEKCSAEGVKRFRACDGMQRDVP
ncbi:hypothetical protein D9613_012172 [Agrocybe pediades]|uniref:Uncharacterized protein n=1 Tax=Agrocybe pediades TaxID=84607 RepID=A0A8H4VTB4_9AGAR|nr:hypothetical protein D9613_012172 [Agrocybe pediades]